MEMRNINQEVVQVRNPPHETHRSRFRCNKLECVLTLLLLSVVIGFAVVMGLLLYGWNGQVQYKVCETEECAMVARRIESYIDASLDPCHDFHKYACAGWQKRNQLPEDSVFYAFNIHVLQERVDKQLREVLEEDVTSDDLEVYKKLKNFYRSCLRRQDIANSTEYHDKIHKILGGRLRGYQSRVSWDPGKWNLTHLIIDLLEINGAPMFDLTFDIDVRNSTQYAIIIGLPNHSGLLSKLFKERKIPLSVSKFSSRVRRALEAAAVSKEDKDGQDLMFSPGILFNLTGKYIYDVFKATERKIRLEDLSKILRRIKFYGNVDPEEQEEEEDLIFMKISELEKLVPTEKEQRNAEINIDIYTVHNISSLQANFPYIEWKRMLKKLISANLEDASPVYVNYPNYMKKLEIFIKTTPPRVLHNTLLSLYVRDVLQELVRVDKPDKNWQFCVDVTKYLFGEPLSGLYLKDRNRTEIELIMADISEMFDLIKNEYAEGLSEVQWMDKSTLSTAINKTLSLKESISSADYYWNVTFLQGLGKDMIISDSFFDSVTQMHIDMRKHLYSIYNQAISVTQVTWSILTHPFVVNAYFIPPFNTIVVPLAILSRPYYIKNAPKYLSYGAIGSTLAHEITHSFDETGSTFDRFGAKHSWWSETAVKQFNQKKKCISQQYRRSFSKKIEINGKTLALEFDGNFTLNENVADIMGLKYAWLAYKRWTELHGHEEILPDLDFNPSQLFFLSSAQVYCSKNTPLGYIMLMEVDEHSPNAERVNGFLMNTEAFAEAFNCPIGSLMNPASRCEIW